MTVLVKNHLLYLSRSSMEPQCEKDEHFLSFEKYFVKSIGIVIYISKFACCFHEIFGKVMRVNFHNFYTVLNRLKVKCE